MYGHSPLTMCQSEWQTPLAMRLDADMLRPELGQLQLLNHY
jgi:hypothetical protein